MMKDKKIKQVNNHAIQSYANDCFGHRTDKSKKNWDIYFLKMAELIASKSKDRSTKVGAVIVGPDNEVLSTGYNGFPRGVDDDVDFRHERPLKYQWVEHAERNAIFNAARNGTMLKGSRLYLNTNAIPCTDCARAMIQSGIISVIGPDKKFIGKGSQWEKDLEVAEDMLIEVGVIIRKVSSNEF